MSTPEELEDLFWYDEEDDTYCLHLWLDPDEKDELIAWCLRSGVSPYAIILLGTRALIEASADPSGTILITGLPSHN